MQVRRETLVLDGLSQVNKLRQRFRGYVRVGFVDQFGVREEGQDMGGVFKEFLDVILREVIKILNNSNKSHLHHFQACQFQGHIQLLGLY